MKYAILLLSALLAACASSDSMVQTRKKPVPEQHSLQRYGDCVSESQIRGFQVLDSRHIVLFGGGRPGAYLVELAPACFSLEHEISLATVDEDGNGRICGSSRDSIAFDRDGRLENCRVTGIEGLTDQRRLEVLGK